MDEENEVDNISIPETLKSTYFKTRATCDNRPLNDYGKQMLDICISTNHIILNGHAKGDEIGRPTRAEGDSKGVIDYAISSFSLLPRIRRFEVGQKMPDSDHCPINVDISISKEERNQPQMEWTPSIKYVVEANKIIELREKLKTALDRDMSLVYNSMADNKSSQEIVHQFQEIIIQCADQCCRKKVVKKPIQAKDLSKPWVDGECRMARKEIAGAKNITTASKMCQDYSKLKKKEKSHF